MTSKVRDIDVERFGRGREALRDLFESETPREELGRRTESARRKLGERAFETVEEYFPEAARRRKRQFAGVGFVMGLATGIVLRHLVDR